MQMQGEIATVRKNDLRQENGQKQKKQQKQEFMQLQNNIGEKMKLAKQGKTATAKTID